MERINNYIRNIENIETITQLPKKKNYTNKNLETKGNCEIRKKINSEKIIKHCTNQKYDTKEILIAAFIYVLTKYTNNKKIIYTLYDKKFIPFYKELIEKKTSELINNVKNILLDFEYKEFNDILNQKNKVINKIIFTYNNKITHEEIEILKNDNEELEFIFNLITKENNIELDCWFDNEKIEENLIKNFIESYSLVLDSIIKEGYIKNIDYITNSDMKQYKEINNTEILIEEKNISSLFEKQVLKNPNKIAVISSEGKLTYNELNKTANKLANILIENKIKTEEIVTIILNRSIYSPVTRQGILKAGGAFLNIIPDYPIERINYILEDCKSRFIITTKEIIKDRPDIFTNLEKKIVISIDDILDYSNSKNPNIEIDSKQLCYCIYTSGSTGKPKGVMIEQRNLLNYCKVNKYNTEASIITNNVNASLALATLTFDVSILEEFFPLLNGGTMVMANEEEIFNPIKLASLVEDNNVEAITCTPSFLNNIIDIEEVEKTFKNIKKFNIGAESFIPSLYNKIKKINNKAEIYNGYGPTEATIGSTLKRINSEQDITIGLPMANIKVYIVNENLEILPIGVPGELIIAGSGVGRGYINNADLTKEKFVSYKNEKAYRSGDLAYINFNGEIEFVGRIDNQIKINGFRIELSEIENVISSFGDIDRSFVKVIENNEEKFIGAYFVAKNKINVNNLNKYLKEHIPYYMMPKFLLQIEEFPTNNNGKIDTKKLPIPNILTKRVLVSAKNDLQKKLCQIFEKILNKDKVGITDNFFEMGGKSLGIMKLIALAASENIKIAYKDVFNHPTVEELEKYLNNNNKEIKEKKEKFSDIKKEYENINNVISYNTLKNINNLHKENNIYNIVISGATGYLGMHVLYEYLINYKGKIYCFIRKGKNEEIQEKFEKIFKHYFERIPKNIYDRVVLVEGDITDVDSITQLEKYNIDTFINCAALVKYFDTKNMIEKINVEGVKNIINYCKKNNVKLIQISTTSIGGTRKIDSNIKPFKENELFFGQGLENKYSETKFLAEKAIINEIPLGLKAKIIRIGNLMPRYKDYQFQINYLDNGFLSMFKAFKHLEIVPENLLGESIELSPVDGIAKTIFLLANTNEEFNIYHSFNNNSIHYYDLIHAMKECGFNIKTVSNELFEKLLEEKVTTSINSENLIGLFADLTASSNEKVVETEADNTFTNEVLYQLGYTWAPTNNEYLTNIFKKMMEKSYFD